jgi:Tfp pilus assembly protein PilN
MRLDINLASQPYEDARQFWMRWGAALGAVVLLTLILLTLDISGWMNARRDRAAISQERDTIAKRDQTRATAETFLNRPENRTTRDESQFLNEVIERKAFSWTKVLESLEKVMPPRVHVVAINPELDEDNQLALKMRVAGDSRDRAIELARRMEKIFPDRHHHRRPREFPDRRHRAGRHRRGVHSGTSGRSGSTARTKTSVKRREAGKTR